MSSPVMEVVPIAVELFGAEGTFVEGLTGVRSHVLLQGPPHLEHSLAEIALERLPLPVIVLDVFVQGLTIGRNMLTY